MFLTFCFFYLFLSFFFFLSFHEVLYIRAVKGNARHGRSVATPTKVFDFVKIILRPWRSESATWPALIRVHSARGWALEVTLAWTLLRSCTIGFTQRVRLLRSYVALSLLFHTISHGTVLHAHGPQFWRFLSWHLSVSSLDTKWPQSQCIPCVAIVGPTEGAVRARFPIIQHCHPLASAPVSPVRIVTACGEQTLPSYL